QSSLLVLGFFIGFIILILFVIYMENARRNIPIRYSKRAVSSEEAVLPLKVNSAGVIPVIFASSFMMVPQIILGLFATGNQSNRWFQIISSIFNMQEPVGAILYVTLIVLFTYFYAFIQVNPEKATENLQRQNAYIPSVRPGRETVIYYFNIKDAYKNGKKRDENKPMFSFKDQYQAVVNEGYPYLVSGPALILLIFTVIFPILFSFALAFTN